MKPTPRTRADILTDIKRIQRKRAANWITPDRCADPRQDMLLCRRLDDLKRELKSLSPMLTGYESYVGRLETELNEARAMLAKQNDVMAGMARHIRELEAE